MAAASAVVVPSVYEGFGLPALEGMAVGVPVVAVRRSSLPEVCGDAAYLVEPDAGALAEGLVAALDGGPETEAVVARGRLRAPLFTWEASVAAHAALWRRYAR
jgi:glycosyltransferase involved in cell wall biosynthesis